MTKRDANKHIKKFDKLLKELVKDLRKYVSSENGEWTIKGFIDLYKNVYTVSSDTKIISKILEIHIFPKLLEFAENNGYGIILPEHQNWYPDLTFVDKANIEVKFALDIKTTFRRENNTVSFTLGSHGSYFRERDKSKNIQFPYNEYLEHFCLGIIYSRIIPENLIYSFQVANLSELNSITSVIEDFDFFAHPKWKIASDSQGSGNTANIGSIKIINDIKKGRGVFSRLGRDIFDEYWINYGNVSIMKGNKAVKINNIWDFLEFKGRKDLFHLVVTNGAKKRKIE